ncbi:hypothetical protein [Pedobacter sp.]|uniref:hypothetical protein n=1 Tax=Pedobacter sp. TaxID=1411316 RepID=UPI00396C7251
MSIRFLTIALLCLIGSSASSQIKLTSGQYTTEDGYYTVTINFTDKELTLIEPNRTSVYHKLEGNVFQFIHPTNKIDYRIEVTSPTTIQTFKPTVNSSRYTLTLSSKNATASNEQFNTYFALAEKYKAKMLSDKKDAQLWSFCAAAAMARSSMNEEGFKEYASKIVSSIKLIVTDKTKCPCEDAIPTNIWNGTK